MTIARLRASAGSVERELAVADDGSILIAGEAHQLDPIGPDEWRVSSARGSAIVHVARYADGCAVHVDGRVYLVEIARTGTPGHRRSSARQHALAAPMPATVLSVVAEIGQALKAGDTVLILEAMKMELPVRAPRDGVVTAIHCSEGELVQPGVTLADMT